MNKVILSGRLTQDIRLSITNGGVKYVRNALAIDREKKGANGEKTTDFIDFVIFNQSAEFTNEYLKKGDLVAVEGRLQMNQYKDTKRLEVMGEKIEILHSKPAEQEKEQDDELPFDLNENLPF